MPGKQSKSRGLAERAAQLPEQVGRAAGLASGFARRLAEAASQLPGADQAQARFRQAERRVLQQLKSRLESVEDDPRPDPGQPGEPRVSRTYVIPLLQSPRKLLQELLDRSLEQTREGAQDDFYAVLLSELVPDEARILAALSDGSAYPVVHIGVGSPIGPVRQRVREFFSTVGRPAQVKLPEFVPLYLEHLRALGLVEEGPEDVAQETRYQIIEGGRDVRDEVEQAKRGSRTASVRLLRRTVRLSPLGQQLWRDCTEGRGVAQLQLGSQG